MAWQAAGLPGPPVSVARGLRGAAWSGLVGAAAPLVLLVGYATLRCILAGASESELMDAQHFLQSALIQPIVGCTVIFACTGWSVYAPAGQHSFAQSLSIIVTVSVPLWFLIKAITIGNPPIKGEPQFLGREAADLMNLICPPLLVASLLTASRVDRAKYQVANSPDRPIEIG